jgi:hypothetical protein
MIIECLEFLGTSTKYIGYNYLVDTTLLYESGIRKNKKVLLGKLLNEISNKYNTKYTSVEKDERVCIDGIFRYGNIDNISVVFNNISGYYDERPSLKLFITTLINYLYKEK